ncbi:hypothetical protein ACLKA6_010153 [Drosophila palustris]
MYRCVRMSHPDEYLQCILWREDPSHELKAYKLDTVTYGTKPAAFLAIRAMHQLSFDEEHDFPIGAKIVRRDFYVDDLMSGGDTVDEVKEIRRQVKDLLLRGHFPIRKWCSNDPAALEGEPECDREKLFKLHDDTDLIKKTSLRDNVVRVAEVKTANNVFRRPVSSLCRLQIISDRHYRVETETQH